MSATTTNTLWVQWHLLSTALHLLHCSVLGCEGYDLFGTALVLAHMHVLVLHSVYLDVGQRSWLSGGWGFPGSCMG